MDRGDGPSVGPTVSRVWIGALQFELRPHQFVDLSIHPSVCPPIFAYFTSSYFLLYPILTIYHLYLDDSPAMEWCRHVEASWVLFMFVETFLKYLTNLTLAAVRRPADYAAHLQWTYCGHSRLRRLTLSEMAVLSRVAQDSLESRHGESIISSLSSFKEMRTEDQESGVARNVYTAQSCAINN